MRHAFCLAALAAATLASAPGEAALPPNHQRLAELRAILDHPAVTAALGSPPIDTIIHRGPDHYEVIADTCHLQVRIAELPMPRGMAGPRRFEVRVGEMDCE